MLKNYFMKISSFFFILFVALFIAAFFIQNAVLLISIATVLFVVALFTLYRMVIYPLNEAFMSISKLDSRVKTERERLINMTLRNSAKNMAS